MEQFDRKKIFAILRGFETDEKAARDMLLHISKLERSELSRIFDANTDETFKCRAINAIKDFDEGCWYMDEQSDATEVFSVVHKLAIAAFYFKVLHVSTSGSQYEYVKSRLSQSLSAFSLNVLPVLSKADIAYDDDSIIVYIELMNVLRDLQGVIFFENSLLTKSFERFLIRFWRAATDYASYVGSVQERASSAFNVLTELYNRSSGRYEIVTKGCKDSRVLYALRLFKREELMEHLVSRMEKHSS